MVRSRVRSLLGLTIAIVVVLALQACREDEQGRPLLYHKGTYQGPSEPPLDEHKVEELRARAERQKY